MSVLSDTILSQARALPEGSVVTPRDFLHLGSRAAIDQTLSRLVRRGALVRLARGLYTLPVHTRFGDILPAPEAVVDAMAHNGDTIVPHGAAAANALGLTQQVPVKTVYMTSGNSRTLRFGQQEVLLKHAPRWLLRLGNRPAGAAIRALHWMGKQHLDTSLATLEKTLPAAEWQALLAARGTLPSHMARAIGKAMTRHG